MPEWRYVSYRIIWKTEILSIPSNYPNCNMGKKGKNPRLTVLHYNVPNMIGQFTMLLAKRGVNIADLTNKSRGRYAYTMIDMDETAFPELEKELLRIENVLKVRLIL